MSIGRFLRDFSLSALVAGFVTVLVGFSSSAVLVFQAARALGADAAQTASWMWALGLGMGITCIVLSLRHRMPVVTAWSTPGAAMLIGAASGVPLDEAVGAFVTCAALTIVAGYSGWFERMIDRIPVSIASGMLAGVLLRFGLEVFTAMQTRFALVATMFAIYLVCRRWRPRFAVPAAGLAGMVGAAGQGLLAFDGVALGLAEPRWVTPVWSLAATVGLALPLFAVTMASQNLPGVAVVRASGFAAPLSPTIGFIGIVNLVLAPFGAFALNLAAITAAICMGREAHDDPDRRYVAAVCAGIFYLLVGVFGAAVAGVFAAFPAELVAAIAGLALFGTIANGLVAALGDDETREPALITFLVTASGVAVAGIGSAFWGLVAGALALALARFRSRRRSGK
ncbi:MAG TPA: benzoate/H(+) symporter BenE family transporter [Burkholderiaceae bacterium]|nr:benzoate/H(+) symporter BenE family transporter [Burkholderiaceae bacterium]